MILILTYDAYEQGTDPVVDWLLEANVPFVRVTATDLVRRRIRYQIDVDRQDVYLDGQSVKESVRVVWYRRFLGEMPDVGRAAGPHRAQLQAEVSTEIRHLFEYLCFILKDRPWLPAPGKTQLNKLEVLNHAQASGLNVPVTRVINNRRDLEELYRRSPNGLITKLIADVRKPYVQAETTYVAVTQVVDAERIEPMSEYFFPTLFQEKVPAQYEVRIFYLDGDCYATAIRSSEPEHVDRKLNGSQKTHYLPYRLPDALTGQIRELMRRLDLNTGCIDLMRRPDGAYVFLEVNPVGQYLAESEHCRYQLDRKIANWLITHNAA